MNKKIIFLSCLILIGFITVVSARMTFIMEDDGVYNLYNNQIVVQKGWNLINFGQQISEDSEIQESDIKAIFYYNPASGDYVRSYPKSDEWNDLMSKDTCGDMSCSAEERESYESWCYKDCKTELNDDIVSHLNVIKEESVILSKNEKKEIDFNKYYDLEVYWNEESLSGTCAERGYSGIDCVMLHHDITTLNLNNDREFVNSPDDGNPYNDYFGNIHLLSSYTDKESLVYVKVEYSSDSKYKFTFYEIDDSKVKRDYNELPVPSFEAKILSQPAWVYSEKRGLLKTESASIKIEQNPLNAGWNFVTITPEFDGKSWSEISQGCKVSKAYVFDSEGQKWIDLQGVYSSGAFGEAGDQGMGIIVKVSESCTLKVSTSTGPPSLPNDQSSPSVPDSNLPDDSSLNSFPNTIGDYTRKTARLDDDTDCETLNGTEVCVTMGRIEYIFGDSAIHVLPTRISSGRDAYVDYFVNYMAESDYEGNLGVFKGVEKWELYWFTSDNDYDMIGTQTYKYIYNSDGSIDTRTLDATTDNPVIQYFLNKYPSIQV